MDNIKDENLKRLGKYIAEVIKSYVPPEIVDTYFEPFCGSLGVMKNMTEYKHIYDESERIIIDESQFFDSESLYQFVYESVVSLHKTVSFPKTTDPNSIKKSIICFFVSLPGIISNNLK